MCIPSLKLWQIIHIRSYSLDKKGVQLRRQKQVVIMLYSSSLTSNSETILCIHDVHQSIKNIYRPGKLKKLTVLYATNCNANSVGFIWSVSIYDMLGMAEIYNISLPIRKIQFLNLHTTGYFHIAFPYTL